MRARLPKLPRDERLQPQTVPIGDQAPSESELRRMIEQAAYYRAERRGFAPGMEIDDWCAAEREVLERARMLRTRI